MHREERQLRAIAELSRRLAKTALWTSPPGSKWSCAVSLLTPLPEIFEKLRGVDLRTLQTASTTSQHQRLRPRGLTPHELFYASPVVHELDRIIVGSKGNPEFPILPRKFNITITGCTDNCTHGESRTSARPAKKTGRLGSTFWWRQMGSEDHVARR